MEQLIYKNNQLDELIVTCKQIWSKLAKETFKRYREIGKCILISGYKKGQWHSEEKDYFMKKLEITPSTFKRMIRLGEVTEKEFVHIVNQFSSLHKWANQSKISKEKYIIEKRLDIEFFKQVKDAKEWFNKMGGSLKGCFWIGTVDKRILEEIDSEKGKAY